MKKFLILLIAVIALSACCESGAPKTVVHPQIERLHVSGFGPYGLLHLEYKGHQYIMIKGSESMAITHDPDCPCHARKESNFSIYDNYSY